MHIGNNLLFQYETILIAIENIKNEPDEVLFIVQAEYHNSINPLLKE